MLNTQRIGASKKTFTIALAASIGITGAAEIVGVNNSFSAIVSAEEGIVPAGRDTILELTPDRITPGIDTDRPALTVYTKEYDRIIFYSLANNSTQHYMSYTALKKVGIDTNQPFEVVSDYESIKSLCFAKNSAIDQNWFTTGGNVISDMFDAPSSNNKYIKKIDPRDPGTSHGYSGLMFELYPQTGQFKRANHNLTIRQNGKEVHFDFTTIRAEFNSFSPITVKPGSTIKLPLIAPISYVLDSNGRMHWPHLRYKLAFPTEGASIDPNTGALTYTPPENFAGGYNEITVEATLDKESLGDIYISGKPRTAVATYRFYVEPQPKSDLHMTVKDNKNGTYTFTKNDGSAAVTIKAGTNGIQSVSQSGSTVTFVMADGSEKTINVDPTSPVKITDNKDGTATITDGKTTLKVVTSNTHLTSVKKVSNGKYEIAQSDGKKWTIDTTSGSVTGLKSDGKGNLVATINGKETTVPLGKVTVTESNPGKSDNKITLTFPDGKTVTFNAVDNFVTDVKKVKDGQYEIARSDGKKWTVDTTSGSVTNLKSDGKGNLVVTINGKPTTVPLDKVTVAESNPGKPDNKITLTLPGGKSVTFNAVDNFVTDVKKNANGDYDIYRSDIGGGKQVWKTIELQDLRNKVAALEAKESPSQAEFNAAKDAINKAQASVGTLERETNTKFNTVHGEITKLKSNVDRVEGLTIDRITSDGKGTYTFTRKNGNTVTGTIDTSGNVTGITPNADGTITVHYNGKPDVTITPEKVQITESKKGTPQHTVTITVPGGDAITFKVFDNYVTDVKKNSNGDYDIYRSDINNGKKVWKTIVLKDLRNKIAALEAKDAPTRTETEQIQKDIADAQANLAELKREHGAKIAQGLTTPLVSSNATSTSCKAILTALKD